MPKNTASGHQSLTLTLRDNSNVSDLPKLKEIFSKYNGDCDVYLKIISPEEWETLLRTNSRVLPSKEMLSEVEGLLGKGAAILK